MFFLEVKERETVLRFPLHRKVNLITTVGIITCTIIRANNNFLLCKDVQYDDYFLDQIYIERSRIIAFNPVVEKPKPEKPKNPFKEKEKRTGCTILKFEDFVRRNVINGDAS